jgi:polysaccharide biosynthesis protein PslA
MASIVTANFDRNNVTPIRRERTQISVRPVEFAGGGARGAYRGRRRPRRVARTEPSSSVAKRIFDIAAASGALLFFAPLLIAIAVAIKATSPGPVLFFQYRYGYRNRRFKIYKFRTMRNDAGDVRGVRQTVQGDARVTPVGRILRKTSLDEIPQLFNVIKGDMSLVGPRPHALSHDREYERRIALYARRHNVKPGITGWAQIHGFRGVTDTDDKMRQRVEYDLYYIDNWWLGLDLQIILRTVISPASYRNAY